MVRRNRIVYMFVDMHIGFFVQMNVWMSMCFPLVESAIECPSTDTDQHQTDQLFTMFGDAFDGNMFSVQ